MNSSGVLLIQGSFFESYEVCLFVYRLLISRLIFMYHSLSACFSSLHPVLTSALLFVLHLFPKMEPTGLIWRKKMRLHRLTHSWERSPISIRFCPMFLIPKLFVAAMLSRGYFLLRSSVPLSSQNLFFPPTMWQSLNSNNTKIASGSLNPSPRPALQWGKRLSAQRAEKKKKSGNHNWDKLGNHYLNSFSPPCLSFLIWVGRWAERSKVFGWAVSQWPSTYFPKIILSPSFLEKTTVASSLIGF